MVFIYFISDSKRMGKGEIEKVVTTHRYIHTEARKQESKQFSRWQVVMCS